MQEKAVWYWSDLGKHAIEMVVAFWQECVDNCKALWEKLKVIGARVRDMLLSFWNGIVSISGVVLDQVAVTIASWL